MKYWAIALSFGIALLLGAWIWISGPNITLGLGFEILYGLWGVSALLAIAVHRKRGLWAIVGLPIAFWWVIAFFIEMRVGS